MNHKQVFLFSAALALPLFSSCAEAKGPSKPSAEVLESIRKRGVLLAGYDVAAWHATDAVQATHPKEGAVRRYLARNTAGGWVVDFGKLNDAGDKFLVSFEAIQGDGPTHFSVTPFEPAREDTGWNLAAAQGIELSLKDFRGADRPYNVAAFPDETGGMYVYVYLAQTKEGVYPYGADARYRLSADGGTVLENRRLHKSVIEVPPPTAAEDHSVGGYHVHILTELPEDTDVLLVLQRVPRVPEYVGAGGYIFAIDVTGKIKVQGRLK